MQTVMNLLRRYDKLILAGMLLVPWLTLPLLGKKAFRRFAPAAFFICLIVAIESFFAHKNLWWLFYKKLFPRLLGEIPLIVGPFFIGTLWIMKLTFGNFIKFFIVNLAIDSLFVYPGLTLFKKLGIASLVRLKKYQFLLMFLTKAVLLYLFQFIREKNNKFIARR